jgi:osmotically inducible protein OsmC
MLQYVSSGAFSRMPLTWGSRTEAHEGRTSPEELLAAAHASCFSMAFANQLAKNGTIAERLDVRVDVTADKRDAGWTVLSSAISVSGVVPGIDAETFARIADAAKDGCPISRALVGNVELSVKPTLLEQ